MKFFLRSRFEKLETFVHHPWFYPALLGTLGALLLFRVLHPFERWAQRDLASVRILVTTRPLALRDIVSEQDLGVATMPARFLPLGAVRVEQRNAIIGRNVLRPMGQGEIFLWSALNQGTTREGPSGHISPGYRAISVLVDEESSVGYQIQDGDFVDILLTLGSEAGKSITMTLLQNASVLATGSRGDGGYASLTLMLLPKEVAVLRHAQTKGRLSFSLRNPHDQGPARIDPYVEDSHLMQAPFRQLLQQEHDAPVEIIRKPKETFGNMQFNGGFDKMNQE
mgnify:CR=1 FL=1